MKKIKKIIFRLFFVTQIVLYGWYYIFGLQGLLAINKLEQENKELKKCIEEKETQLCEIKHTTDSWQKDSFYKEKYAREQLQMAYPDETIYFIS